MTTCAVELNVIATEELSSETIAAIDAVEVEVSVGGPDLDLEKDMEAMGPNEILRPSVLVSRSKDRCMLLIRVHIPIKKVRKILAVLGGMGGLIYSFIWWMARGT